MVQNTGNITKNFPLDIETMLEMSAEHRHTNTYILVMSTYKAFLGKGPGDNTEIH